MKELRPIQLKRRAVFVRIAGAKLNRLAARRESNETIQGREEKLTFEAQHRLTLQEGEARHRPAWMRLGAESGATGSPANADPRSRSRGALTASAISAGVGVANIAAAPGNCGQVKGTARAGVDPACALVASLCMAIAQWCAPCRRQHIGRLAS